MILVPRPVALWLNPIEVGVIAVWCMFTVTTFVALRNHAMLKELIAIHRIK